MGICGEDCKDNIGNCLKLGKDGFPVQCVGGWVEDKFYYLERFLNSSREVRRKFSEKGNAVYIDLFSGPGKCIIKNKRNELLGGVLRVFNREEAPFNEFYCFDKEKENIRALKQRTNNGKKIKIKIGDSNKLIYELVKKLLKKKYRYHFAFIDPFGPEGLKFETISELAKLDRMDMLIHFPIGAIKRNYDNWLKNPNNTILDNFLGTDEWQKVEKAVFNNKIYKVLIDVFKKQLRKIGYPQEGLQVGSENDVSLGLEPVTIRNTKNVKLYDLILISKHTLGQKIWESSIKVGPNGQRRLF